MAVVHFDDDFQGFANGTGPYIRTINNVPTTVSGNVTVDFTAFGDFSDELIVAEWLDIVVEGVNLGRLFDLDSSNDRFDFAGDTTTQYGVGGIPSGTATITSAEWQTIIADGIIEITYTVGGDVTNLQDDPEEYLNIEFSWNSVIGGTPNSEWLRGTSGDDEIHAFAGDDVVGARGGNDTVEAGDGNDQVFGGAGNDKLHGQNADDRVFGGLGNDDVYGEAGNDTLGGGAGEDHIRGGNGNEVVYGAVGNDTVWADGGNDLIFGGDGNDTILGGAGDDTIFGGPGADRFGFNVGSGNDVVYGLGDTDEIDLEGQTYASALNADGNLVLTLSGGGTVELFGVTAINEDWFV